MPSTRKGYQLVRAVFEATLACNLSCRHCGSRAGKPRADELTTEEAARLFAELAAVGCRRVTISGGEALLRPDWPELIESAALTGMKVGLITNGLRFDPETAARARDLGLGAVGFSVDGSARTHDLIRGRIGHFAAVERAIDAARGAGLPFALVTHLNRRNVGELAAIHDLARERGAYAWQVQTGTAMGNLADHRELLPRPRDLVRAERALAELARRDELRIVACNSLGYFGPADRLLRQGAGGRPFDGCPAGTRVVGIESNGNVKGCLAIMPGAAGHVEGNVRDEPLGEIWHRPGAFAYNREWSIDDLAGFCRECLHAVRCRGGCTANRVASGDGTDNPICIHRALVEQQLGTPRPARAAAAIALAALLGASAHGCRDTDAGDGRDGSADDGGVDGDVDGDTDTDTDMDVDADGDAYDLPSWG